MILSDGCLSVAYIGNNSRTERLRKTKTCTQVAHVTRDSGITFKIKRSKVNLQGCGSIVTDSHTSLIIITMYANPSQYSTPLQVINLIFINSLIFMVLTAIGSKARWAPQA